MRVMMASLLRYETLSELIRTNLQQYNWNLDVLSPKDLANICNHKGIEFREEPLGVNATGYYRVVNGLPEVIVNSDLTDTAKWFASSCKIASHFTNDPSRARALGAIALMPTWMLREYSFRELQQLGYCDTFLQFRQQLATTFPDVGPIKYAHCNPVRHIREIVNLV